MTTSAPHRRRRMKAMSIPRRTRRSVRGPSAMVAASWVATAARKPKSLRQQRGPALQLAAATAWFHMRSNTVPECLQLTAHHPPGVAGDGRRSTARETTRSIWPRTGPDAEHRQLGRQAPKARRVRRKVGTPSVGAAADRRAVQRRCSAELHRLAARRPAAGRVTVARHLVAGRLQIGMPGMRHHRPAPAGRPRRAEPSPRPRSWPRRGCPPP